MNVILVQAYGTNMTEILLTNEIVNNFLQHGKQDYPVECCGFILGYFKDEKAVGKEYIAATNKKKENKTGTDAVCQVSVFTL